MNLLSKWSAEIRKIISSDFIKNVFVLMKGVTIAQLFSLASLPILTRYFTPEEFGYIAVYLSIAKVMATISTGRYELAIMLPKNDNSALKISFISILFITVTALFSSVVIYLFALPIAELFNIQEEKHLLWFLPISIIFLGLYQTAYYWSSRKKNFKYMANSRILQSASTSVLNMGAGFLSLGTSGLLFGNLSGQFLSAYYLIKKLFNNLFQIKTELTRKDLLIEMREYKNFPYYSMPMGFLNSISGNLLVYVLSIFFSAQLVGFYSHANRVLNYPLFFISSSFTSVFYQKLNDTHQKLKLYTYSYFVNLVIATLILLPIIFWGDSLFAFVFGEQWIKAGTIAGIIVPLAITSFAMRSVSDVFSATKKNHILLGWQIIYFSISLTVIFIFKDLGINLLLNYFTIIGSLLYIILAYFGYKILKKTSETKND